MEDDRILNSQITASSIFKGGYEAWRGRLNYIAGIGGGQLRTGLLASGFKWTSLNSMLSAKLPLKEDRLMTNGLPSIT